MSLRQIQQLRPAQQVSDGAGVKIRRSIGLTAQWRLDPFLMLDCFGSDQPGDYIAGFPPHPHRGFETVTYMLDGHMLHQDHLGNQGHLKSGGVQWMTAGSGIIHSEMPQQESGLMRGFQLWINLPAAEKMKDPHYVDLEATSLTHAEISKTVKVVVIAGELKLLAPKVSLHGPIQGISTQPLFADFICADSTEVQIELPNQHHALVYPYEGELMIGATQVASHHAAILSAGTQLTVQSAGAARFLVLAAQPIQEPIAQYGPFVMNSSAEIEQAIQEYQHGTFIKNVAQQRS